MNYSEIKLKVRKRFDALLPSKPKKLNSYNNSLTIFENGINFNNED